MCTRPMILHPSGFGHLKSFFALILHFFTSLSFFFYCPAVPPYFAAASLKRQDESVDLLLWDGLPDLLHSWFGLGCRGARKRCGLRRPLRGPRKLLCEAEREREQLRVPTLRDVSFITVTSQVKLF